MTFETIASLIEGVPITPPSDGKILYDFILASGRSRILELGFAHGTSTCYMAAALDAAGTGSLVTIDRVEARSREPNILALLDRTGLGHYVTPIFSESSYTWELKKMIEEQTKENATIPMFDFCFIDGVHAWDPDGFAFLLAEKLLVPGGWILLDDLNWSYDGMSGPQNTDWPVNMPPDFNTAAQMEMVFSLLVMQHSSFENFRREGRWGWAQKKSTIPDNSARLLDQIYLDQSIAGDLKRLLKKIARRIMK
jgi:predicted O-methyltransferase YrrM